MELKKLKIGKDLGEPTKLIIWKNNVDNIAAREKTYSANHINFFLDRNKNISKIVACAMDNSYQLSNVIEFAHADKIPKEGLGFIYSKETAYKFLKEYRSSGLNYLYMDNGYFSKFLEKKVTRFRIAVNQIHPQKVIDFNLPLKFKVPAWQMRDDLNLHILVCLPTSNPRNNILSLFDFKRKWLFNTIREVREQTDRKILIRFRNYQEDYIEAKQEAFFEKISKQFGNIVYTPEVSQRGLIELLDKSYAVIAPASGASVIAAFNGIPVFSENFSPVASIAHHDYRLINQPIYPDRSEWLRTILGHEFTLQDINSGRWLVRLKQIYPEELKDVLDEKINLL